MCTARDRSSLIPSRVSPRWRATLSAGSRWAQRGKIHASTLPKMSVPNGSKHESE